MDLCGDHQTGFVRGRVIWDNVLELDTYLRMYTTMPACSPVAVLLDQAKAFTALDQGFLFKVLIRAGTPRRVPQLLARLCKRNEMAVQVGRAQPAFIHVIRGIKRGCPASASIWAICFEPVLFALSVALGTSPSHVLAFAGDVGLALSAAVCIHFVVSWNALCRCRSMASRLRSLHSVLWVGLPLSARCVAQAPHTSVCQSLTQLATSASLSSPAASTLGPRRCARSRIASCGSRAWAARQSAASAGTVCMDFRPFGTMPIFSLYRLAVVLRERVWRCHTTASCRCFVASQTSRLQAPPPTPPGALPLTIAWRHVQPPAVRTFPWHVVAMRRRPTLFLLTCWRLGLGCGGIRCFMGLGGRR